MVITYSAMYPDSTFNSVLHNALCHTYKFWFVHLAETKSHYQCCPSFETA